MKNSARLLMALPAILVLAATPGHSGPPCSCTPFVQSGACGTGTGCLPTQHPETRTCTAAGCDVEEVCVDDCACGSLVDANGQSCTVPVPNAPTAEPFSNVSTNQIQANWGANINPQGTLYTAILSIAPSPSTNGQPSNQTTVTTNLSQVFTGLAINGVYYVEVKAENAVGSSPFTSLGHVATLASAPTPLGPSSVLPTQITANWGANGNPSGTAYVAEISADVNFSTLLAIQQTTATSFAFQGLTPVTQYFMRVYAVNADGIQTAPVVLPSATTPPSSVTAPTLSGTAGSDSSISWSWTAVSNASGYRLLDSAGTNISGDLPPTTLAFGENNLQVNSPYDRRVAALFGSIQAISNGLVRYTLARPPVSIRVLSVSASSVTVAWDANGNPPARTRYRIQANAASGAPVTVDVGALQGTLSPLTAGTTYFIQVISLNGDGIPSIAGSAAGSTDDRIQVITLGSAVSAALSGARVYPNPYRPFSGDLTVTFDGLPPGTAVQIYTLLGERVVELTADSTGMIVWDVRNAHGQPAASGVYFALLKAGGDKRTVKLAVER